MTDHDHLDHQKPKHKGPPAGPPQRTAILIQTELDEARWDMAEAEIKRDPVAVERLRHVLHDLINELQPKILDPHMQAHGPIRRHPAPYHQKKAKA